MNVGKINPENAKLTEITELNPYDNPYTDQESKRKKIKKKNWTIAASVNTGGRSYSDNKSVAPVSYRINDFLESPDGSNPTNTPETGAETKPFPPSRENISDTGYLSALENGTFSGVTHLPPLSFGIRVRKDIGKRFALESGLTYTYLLSKYSDSRPLEREASLNMHYLGIPLNGVIYLTDHPKWNVYFLAGGMMEKGIWSVYQEKTYLSGNEFRKFSDSKHTKGMQWSLNASFGIGYNLYRDLSIYFEPNITYYLKNNQPISARTENPLIVGLSAGVRFRFK